MWGVGGSLYLISLGSKNSFQLLAGGYGGNYGWVRRICGGARNAGQVKLHRYIASYLRLKGVYCWHKFRDKLFL